MHRAVFLFLAAAGVGLTAETAYQKPPQDVLDVLNAKPTPLISVSPARDYAILMQPVRYPSITEVSQPMLRLAGLRIDANTNGLHLAPNFSGYELKKLADGSTIALRVPTGAKLSMPSWSPDGRRFLFTNTTEHAIDLWLATTVTGEARQVSGVRINGIRADGSGPRATHSFAEWLGDNHTVLLRLVPSNRGAAPADETVPKGPHVQESSGRAGPVRTYEDMLSTPHDEDVFDYYGASQLAWLDTTSLKITPVGSPGIFETAQPSPDGKHLLIGRVHRPYSYLYPVYDFPKDVEVWNPAGKTEYQVASLPLADRVPIEGVRTGPRAYQWLPEQDAALVWAEAMDGGNPKEKVPHRDRIVMLGSPFTGHSREVFETEQRFRGLQPLEHKGLALVEDYERNKRWLRTIEIDMNKPGDSGKVIFSRNVQDRYKDPGTPLMKTLPNGKRVVMQQGDTILLAGTGASPSGDKPFLDRYNLATGKAERLFQSNNGYETLEAVLDDDGNRTLVMRESPTEPPNYFIRTGTELKALTHFADPAPQIRSITKQLVTYKREDGVPLSFTLYLPPDYKAGTRLPTVVWAYPLEYNDADTASQVSGSTERFTTLAGHLLFLMHGYAVLENAGMPIIGDPETVNNTYLNQLTMDAKAAIGKAVELGVTDRDRVGVGGHSYGAFMTANLLAHTNLFRAGIAESGAYNRTLTPFGFQSERRTFWEAPDVYTTMSPFWSANKIKTPLLMIHGEADDNTGTFPIQSERLYQAIRGNGGTVRLVMLPSEAHGYRAKETHEHVLWEELNWLDKYLKGTVPGQTAMQPTL
ncbi:MAG: prolyl oligopeptidase family serine peptidase [Acidobacteriota bacterium]|nr:prolyl oligopeptidase family serine peptidase [Acidobacteriota bacterium]